MYVDTTVKYCPDCDVSHYSDTGEPYVHHVDCGCDHNETCRSCDGPMKTLTFHRRIAA